MDTSIPGATPLDRLAGEHYENFPVASKFIPRRYRRVVHLIYAFARVGDDIADEWDGPPEERLQALDDWQEQLHRAVEAGTGTVFFIDLAAAISAFHLDLALFDDLIEAFRMDIRHSGFASYDDLLFYCRHSANPVGRLMLQIFGCATQQNCELSDTLCTALQLANFWQDLLIDTVRHRYYVPVRDCRDFAVTRDECMKAPASQAVRKLVKHEIDRTKTLFIAGRPLLGRVPADFRFELRLIWLGGMKIVQKIEAQEYDTLSRRPVLSVWDKLSVLIHAMASRY